LWLAEYQAGGWHRVQLGVNACEGAAAAARCCTLSSDPLPALPALPALPTRPSPSASACCSVVLWEMLTWDLPWGSTNPWQVVTIVTEGGRLELPARERLPGPDSQVRRAWQVVSQRHGGCSVWLSARPCLLSASSQPPTAGSPTMPAACLAHLSLLLPTHPCLAADLGRAGRFLLAHQALLGTAAPGQAKLPGGHCGAQVGGIGGRQRRCAC
jgi:hypothetical protein